MPVWNKAQGVDLCHEDVGWDHVELDVNKEWVEHLHQGLLGCVRVLFTPHECCLISERL